ncbi:MAG TPA: hypothetical protein VHC41_07860 [Mycobacteriales bacterium]|nr:hypothetical protein [Mycobacteriales bacterium]
MPFVPAAPREWITFPDPVDPDHEIRADLSFLLSGWSCIFGHGCQGITGDAEVGCCSHGAFFTDAADEKRVRSAARELTPLDWQRHGRRTLVEVDELDGEPARRTATADGACIYANRSDHPGGAGCALHALALRTGRHPLELKPDVCWQVPISRSEEVHEDGSRTTTITEFSRRSWGEGGADLHWWCTESKAAHRGKKALFETYAAELVALIGDAAYAELVQLCRLRRKGRPPKLPLI